MSRPTPVNAESPFDFHELFFSTTDLRGVIQFGNGVFVRVSNYPKDKMIGAPHSIIRHPDMPRAVFKVLWQTIQAGQPIVAYVKNLAANGHYYWVMAFVFPIEEGYLSIRIKPSSALFEATKEIYAKTLAFEEAKDLEESVPYLVAAVQAAGFKSYQEFMVKAAFAELNALQAKSSLGQEKTSQTGIAAKISDINGAAAQDLKTCFEHIQDFQKGSDSFVKTMSTLTEAFQHLKYIALNMTISAAKFGEDAVSLGVVAKEFSALSGQIQEHLTGLSDFVLVLSELVERCAVKIVCLETQMLMVDFFIKESLEKMSSVDNAFEELVANRANFSMLFKKYSLELFDEIQVLEKDLAQVISQMSEVRKFTTGLEVIRQIGAVESSRENEMRQTFVHYLEEMRKFIHLLQTSTQEIQREMQNQKLSSKTIMETASHLSSQVDSIFDLAGTTSTLPQ